MSKGYKQIVGQSKIEDGVKIYIDHNFAQHLYNDGKNEENLDYHKRLAVQTVLDTIEDYLTSKIKVTEKYPVNDLQEINLSIDVCLIDEKKYLKFPKLK